MKTPKRHAMYDPTLPNELRKLRDSIEKQKSVVINRLNDSPEGFLRISQKRDKNQYYHRTGPNDPNGKYIPENDHLLAERLAQKDYDTKLLKVLNEQQKTIERFLNDFDPEAAEQVYNDLSEQRKALVTPEHLSDEEFIRQWLSQPYTRLGFDEGDQEFYTANGERVRSKSEILIADALLRNNVPYLCEYPVYNHGVIFAAPDFKCLNVRLRKVYYWEHLGKLGDPGYANRNVKKLDKYALADDFDETELILTFETDSHPLNTRVIEEKIRKYLL